MGIISNGTTIIDSGAIGSSKVDTTQIAADAVETAKIADSQITLAKLSASGTKNSTTFLRGDNTFAAAGGGLILQAITGLKVAKQTNSGGYTNATDAVVTITPAATSSKILVAFSCSVSSSGGGDPVMVKMTRTISGSTVDSFVGTGTGTDSSSGSMYVRSSTAEQIGAVYLDSPNTTSAVTYQLQFNSYSNRTSVIGGTYDSSSNAPTNVTCLEVSG